MLKKTVTVFTEREIAERIHTIRGQQVLLDRDLAEFYGVRTEVLNQAVKRNKKRFPAAFMFRLNFNEYSNLRSQNVISKGRGGPRYLPHAFNEYGVTMLAGVLKSDRAIQLNIQIVIIFTRLRRIITGAANIQEQVKLLGHQVAGDKQRLDVAFDAINFLLDHKEKLVRG